MLQEAAKDTAMAHNEWHKLLKAYLTRIVLYGVILLAIYIGSKIYLAPAVKHLLPSWVGTERKILDVAITLAAMSPFLYGLGINSGSINESAPKLIKEKQSNIWPLIGLTLVRSFIVIAMVLVVISSYFQLAGWTVFAIILAGLLFILFARRSMHKFNQLEQHFLSNYNEREEVERRSKPVSNSVRQKLADYGVNTVSLTLAQESSLAGTCLKDIPFRSESGANIIKITRGRKNIIVPSGDVMLFPNLDELEDTADINFEIKSVTLTADSFLTGKTLRSANLRRYQCMVISVLHCEEIVTNPEPDFMFTEGDTVWLAGDLQSLGWI